MHTNQLPHGNRTPPHLRGTAPLTNPAGAAGRRTAPLRTQAGAGDRTSPLPLPPASNPGTTHHSLEAAELAGAEPREGGGVLVEEGAGAAAAAARCVQSAPTRASQQSLFHSVPSHHVPQVRSTRTRPAPLPQLESIDRRQRQYRVDRRSRLARTTLV